MTRTLTECPTCHEHIPFVWHGHHAVASSPEDDDPWCKHCNRPLDDIRSNVPADYCPNAGDENRRLAVNELAEPEHDGECDVCNDRDGIIMCPEHEDRADTDSEQPEHGAPFTRAEQTFLP